MTEAERNDYTSQVPFDDTPADCIVICCSDPRFEEPTEDFVRNALGFRQPHCIQVPSGPAVFSPSIALKGFLPKSMNALLDKAVELTQAPTILIVGHRDCGGYKAGRHEIVRRVGRRFAGKDTTTIQHDHLQEVGRAIHRHLGGRVEVRAFYADLVDEDESRRVRFGHIASWDAGTRAVVVSTRPT